MKSILLVLSALGLSFAAWTPAAPPRAAQSDLMTKTGVVSGVHLDMSGTVYLRLEGAAADGKSESEVTWFCTPPEQSSLIRVEELLLMMVHDGKGEFTLAAEKDRTLDGEDVDGAYPLVYAEKR